MQLGRNWVCSTSIIVITIISKDDAWYEIKAKKTPLKRIWINSISQRHIETKQNITEKISLRILIKIN